MLSGLPVTDDRYLSFGILVLHSWIRLYEYLLHIAYKLPVKVLRIKKSTRHIVKKNEKRIKKELKLNFFFELGNSNTGRNIARKFF